MIKKIIISATILGLLIIVGIVALESGRVYVPEWYRKTDRSKEKSMRNALLAASTAFEQIGHKPPDNSVEILEGKSERWGTPVQYSYENGEPTIRAAGKDGELNTKDDLKQKVRITNQVTLRDDPHGQS